MLIFLILLIAKNIHMKITVFTSNQPRHVSLINKLAAISEDCFAVIESNTLFPGQTSDFFNKSEVMQSYFSNVQKSEAKFFGSSRFLRTNVHSLVMKSGDLNKLHRDILEPALQSDIYVVFGSSYIKGWLIEDLIDLRAINIHMGVSPYYRGSSCNFWASHQRNFHMVGSTIHMLSRGLDSGDILYHALPTLNNCSSLFDFTMKSVVSAHDSLVSRISDNSILSYSPVKQDRSQEVTYTRNSDFNDEVASKFLDSCPELTDVDSILLDQRNNIEYINPYFS